MVSINLCTDQLAMLIAEEGQLISVSKLAQDPQASVLAPQAAGYRVNHSRAEEVFLMEPDLVLAGVFTARATVSMLQRLGFRVEQFEPATSFDGVRANIRRMGSLLGREATAEALVAEFDADLSAAQARARLSPGETRPRLALRQANSYTSGAGTLADETVEAAGFANVAAELGVSGTAKLPLETLVMADPDLIVGAGETPPGRAYESLAHPALRGAPVASVPDRYWICGGPFTARAVSLLSAARESLRSSPPLARAKSQRR